MDDLAGVVDVVDEVVERADPLRQAALDRRPLARGDDPRHEIERERAVSTGPSPGPPASNVIPCCMKIASRLRPGRGQRLGPERLQRLDERARVRPRLPVGARPARRRSRGGPGPSRCVHPRARAGTWTAGTDRLYSRVISSKPTLSPSTVAMPIVWCGRAAALGRRAGVEDLKAVRRTRAAGCASGRRRPPARRGTGCACAASRPAGRAGVVDHADLRLLELDRAHQRQPRDQLGAVDVPAHRVHRRPERLQRFEHLELHEVAGVQDRVGAAVADARVGKPASPRHVRVGDHRDDHGELPA